MKKLIISFIVLMLSLNSNIFAKDDWDSLRYGKEFKKAGMKYKLAKQIDSAGINVIKVALRWAKAGVVTDEELSSWLKTNLYHGTVRSLKEDGWTAKGLMKTCNNKIISVSEFSKSNKNRYKGNCVDGVFKIFNVSNDGTAVNAFNVGKYNSLGSK